MILAISPSIGRRTFLLQFSHTVKAYIQLNVRSLIRVRSGDDLTEGWRTCEGMPTCRECCFNDAADKVGVSMDMFAIDDERALSNEIDC